MNFFFQALTFLLVALATVFCLPRLWQARWKLDNDGKIRKKGPSAIVSLSAFLVWATTVLLMVVAFSVRT